MTDFQDAFTVAVGNKVAVAVAAEACRSLWIQTNKNSKNSTCLRHFFFSYAWVVLNTLTPSEMTMGHTFWPVTHVTHQSIDPWLLTSHDSRLLQFSLQWANGPTVPITYMRYRRTFMSLSEVSEQQHMKLKASMEQQWNKSYKTHEAQSDLSKTDRWPSWRHLSWS